MDFQVTSAKVLGAPSKTGWAQVHDFVPEDKKKLKLRGHLFALISTKKEKDVPGKQEIETVAAGREILSRLHEEYFGKLDTSAFNALKKAVEKVAKEFSSWGDIQISAAALVEGVLYSAVVGGGEVGVFRNGSYATILRSKEDEAIAASGYPKENDFFLLATTDFYQRIGQGVVKAAISTGILKEIVETLAPAVHSQENFGSSGLAIIKFEKKSVLSKITSISDKKEKKQETEIKEIPAGIKTIEKITSFLKGVVPKKPTLIKRREIPAEELQKRKTALSIAAVLLTILLVSIGFGIQQKRKKEQKMSYEERLVQAEHNLEEAISLFSLSPDRSRELLSESKRIVEELETEGVKDERLARIKQEITTEKERILGEYTIQPQLFLDLAPISENFFADVLSSTNENLALLDKKGERVVKVIIGTKTTEVVSGPAQIKDPKGIGIYEDRIFVLEEEGIYEVGDTKIKSADNTWEGEVLFSVYAGNLYVLDKGSSEIHRYSGSGVDFGSKKSWLAPGIEIDLSKIVSMTIDGMIWIISGSGNIEKYSYGNPQPLETISVSPPMINPLIISTNEKSSGVYLLDPTNSRIVALDKKGKYIAQYTNEKLNNSTGLAVSEEKGLIIFLSENKLYSIEVKHM